ncbi:LysR family transcriptional regulator [Alphaproteobacteria bacterium]|nr:LysR family transcriptional regulator [Alphaproteobacteria bacterium]
MRYNLITLDLFLCASKYKSLVKAAKKNLVVSAVSKRILDLEKSVGVNLFYRKKTGVELTPAGLEMQKHCTKIFNSINIMDEIIKEHFVESSGILRGTYASSITQFLPEEFAGFSKIFTKIKI